MVSRDELRVGDAERAEVTAALREHFAQGRLSHEELDERLGLALSARTAGELARITADLPRPDGPGTRPRRQERPAPADLPFPAGPAAWGHHAPVAHRERPCPHRSGPRHREPHLGGHHHHWHRHGRHHGPPLLAILAVALVISIVTGSFWLLPAAVKVLFLLGPALAVAGLIHHRHHRQRS